MAEEKSIQLDFTPEEAEALLFDVADVIAEHGECTDAEESARHKLAVALGKEDHS